MKLTELAQYKRIVIQCHNNPDADAVGSGFALQCFLSSHGCSVDLLYGGQFRIQKPSLLMMLEALGIEINQVQQLPADLDLLITVDCQRVAGNVEFFDLPVATVVAVIDHHKPEIPENEYTLIRPNLASCATLVWSLLKKENYALDERAQTALYYGLFSDTNGLSELRHPLDRDLADIPNDAGLIRKLKNSAVTEAELDVIGATLRQREIIGNIGLFHAEPCDQNLLGFTSDIAQQVVHMDCCVVYCLQPHELKLSIRSSTREIMADEIARFLCSGTGDGGGALEKAGGRMSLKVIAAVAGKQTPEDYLKNRIRAYLTHYELIYAGNNQIDFGAMRLYQKRLTTVGFIPSTDLYPAGTKITIRTLEGDVDTLADENIYLMIGLKGEIYPIQKATFETNYHRLSASYLPPRFSPEAEYTNTVLNRTTGERQEDLHRYAKACAPREHKLVRAKALERDAKVFTKWDPEKYFSGVTGDWLVANEGSYEDCYIVRQDIFAESYQEV